MQVWRMDSLARSADQKPDPLWWVPRVDSGVTFGGATCNSHSHSNVLTSEDSGAEGVAPGGRVVIDSGRKQLGPSEEDLGPGTWTLSGVDPGGSESQDEKERIFCSPWLGMATDPVEARGSAPGCWLLHLAPVGASHRRKRRTAGLKEDGQQESKNEGKNRTHSDCFDDEGRRARRIQDCSSAFFVCEMRAPGARGGGCTRCCRANPHRRCSRPDGAARPGAGGRSAAAAAAVLRLASMAGGGGASLRELSSLLAGNAELAAEKLGVILCQCPPSGSLHDGSTRLHPRQLSAILAVAQFLSQSSSSAEEIQMDLWHVILEFLRTIPYYGQDDIWSSAFSSLWATAFFKDFMLAVVKFTKSRAVLAAELSTIIADIIQKITALSNREVSAPIAPGVKFFLVALSENCPHLSADDVERVIKALLEQWAVNFQPGNTQPSSSDTSYHSSPSMSKKSHQHTPQSNGTSSPYKDSQSTPPQYNSINVHGLVSRYEHQLDPSPTTSTSTILTNAFTPSKLVEDHVTSRSGQLNGSGRGGLDYFYNAQPEVQGERGSSMRLQGNALEGESLYVLERQEIAFRLVSHILEKADGDRVVSDLVQLRNSAVLQLKGVLPLLKASSLQYSLSI
ncbi:hypothetical protein AXG93_3253s1290 [Marchantia polymorpha subsp. ruderalis]|uniref:Uncharacterized protein n=1 Tax=Marchantia polymorpha subsp. ruderalis TaxID=1480154 RepID=A0A176WRA2_MARPO|nr:hypothetical protein AXG93_3253s1290 [Marchantia polymorpha subsp. ruderalis]